MEYMSQANFSFTRISGNKKTGYIPTTMSSVSTCPNSCPFKKDKICYPFYSPLGFMWEALDTNGRWNNSKRRIIKPIKWNELLKNIKKLPKGQLWRHNVAGDLPGHGDRIDVKKLAELISAAKNTKGFTYKHKPIGYNGFKLVNAQAIYASNQSGFTINLSANTLVEADSFYDFGIGPVVSVLQTDSPLKVKTPKGRKVIVCPAEYKEDVQCETCKLCAKKDRKVIIGFRAHGTKKRSVNRKLNELL